MQPGDVIRVERWSGTRGQRFIVRRVDEKHVYAVDDDMKLRTFPRANCHVERLKTKAERNRG